MLHIWKAEMYLHVQIIAVFSFVVNDPIFVWLLLSLVISVQWPWCFTNLTFSWIQPVQKCKMKFLDNFDALTLWEKRLTLQMTRFTVTKSSLLGNEIKFLYCVRMFSSPLHTSHLQIHNRAAVQSTIRFQQSFDFALLIGCREKEQPIAYLQWGACLKFCLHFASWSIFVRGRCRC